MPAATMYCGEGREQAAGERNGAGLAHCPKRTPRSRGTGLLPKEWSQGFRAGSRRIPDRVHFEEAMLVRNCIENREQAPQHVADGDVPNLLAD